MGVIPVYDNFPKNPQNLEKFGQQKNTCTDLSIRQPLRGTAGQHCWFITDGNLSIRLFHLLFHHKFSNRATAREFDDQDILKNTPSQSKMADDELSEIRARRMAELQQQMGVNDPEM